MGSSFFKGKPPSMSGGNTNLEARALAAPGYAGRTAAIGAQKALSGAQAANKEAIKAHGPMKRSAAYPPGPKV
jgi:hypothetical protein